MHLNLRLFVITLCFSLLTYSSHASTDELTIGVSTGYPPYYYETNGKLGGICIEIVDSVAKSLDIKIVYKQYPWKRLLKNAREGRVDAIMPLFRTEEREKFLYFENLAIAEETNSFFTWKNTPISYDGAFVSLQQYTIGVVADYSYGKKFDTFDGFNKVITLNDNHLVTMFKHKRFPVGVGNKNVTLFHAGNLGIGDKIQFLTPYITSEMLYIGFSRHKGQKVSRDFARSLQSFKNTASYRKILNTYDVRKSKYPHLPAD